MGEITAFLPKNIFIYLLLFFFKVIHFPPFPFPHYDQTTIDLSYNLQILSLELNYSPASNDTKAYHSFCPYFSAPSLSCVFVKP